MKSMIHERLMKNALGFFLLIFLTTVYAVDNPERPDYVNEFHQRISVAEREFSQQSSSILGQSKTGNQLIFLLESELETALKNAFSDLQAEHLEGLKASQAQWRRHFEEESVWIDDYFTKERVGSSYVTARAASKAQLLKNRVEQILNYLKGMP